MLWQLKIRNAGKSQSTTSSDTSTYVAEAVHAHVVVHLAYPRPLRPQYLEIFRDKNTRRIGKSQSNRQVAGRNGRRTVQRDPGLHREPLQQLLDKVLG